MNFLLILLAACTTLAAAQLVIPGGKQTIDVHDELLKSALRLVEPQINGRLGSPLYHRIGRVVEAEAQIVDGLVYTVTLEVVQTTCLMTAAHLEDCPATEGHLQMCHAGIFSQPWEHKAELTYLQCSPVEAPRPDQDGGLFAVDTEDAEMRKALLSVEKVMSEQYHSPYVSQVGKVLEAKAQVVAGLKYYITFKFGQTYRLKSQTTEQPERRSEVVRSLVTCHVQLSMKPGAEVGVVLSFNCDH